MSSISPPPWVGLPADGVSCDGGGGGVEGGAADEGEEEVMTLHFRGEHCSPPLLALLPLATIHQVVCVVSGYIWIYGGESTIINYY